MKCSMHYILSGVDRRALHAMLTYITPPWTGNLIVSCPCCMCYTSQAAIAQGMRREENMPEVVTPLRKSPHVHRTSRRVSMAKKFAHTGTQQAPSACSAWGAQPVSGAFYFRRGTNHDHDRTGPDPTQAGIKTTGTG